MSIKLDDVLKKYQSHPDFIGLDLVDVNQPGAVDDAPIHVAARGGGDVDILNLVAVGANVNLPGDLGNTPLHYAAMSGRLEIVELLLNLGANSALRNEFFQTAFDVARLGGHFNICEILSGSAGG